MKRIACYEVKSLFCTLAVVGLLSTPVLGQTIPGITQPPSSEEANEQESLDVQPTSQDRVSPRATMRTFLDAMSARDWSRAIATLDLRHENLAADVLATRGKDVAAELKAVIDRIAFVRFEEIPNQVGGQRRYVWHSVDNFAIALERVESGEWLFSRDTIETLPQLWEVVRERDVVEGVEEAPRTMAMRIRESMPAGLRNRGFILEYWQWLALALLVFVGVVSDKILTFVLQRSIAHHLAVRFKRIDEDLVHSAIRPFGLVVMAVIWWLGLLVLGLPGSALAILLIAVKFVTIASVVWTAYRAVDIATAILEQRAERTETKYDDLLVPLIRKSAKIFIAAFGIVFLADNLNINITSLLAGLGLGGIAFALAAQDTVKNLFGSLTVLLDRPFQVGDWVVVGGVEGTVEEVGFRSTRIRTFYNSLITLPNANLISAHVDNYGARRYRRWKTHLGVAYDTPPEKVDAICEGIRELVRRHPYTRKDYFHV